MTKAIAALSSVAYIAEVTDGTTPATPAFTTFRAISEALDINRKLSVSRELGKRGEKNYAVASANGTGSLGFKWTDATLEDFLESALRAAWSTDILTDGNTPKSFTAEVRHEAGGTDVFKRVKGAQVRALSLNMRSGEDVDGSVELMGRIATYENAIVASATYNAGNAEPIMVGADIGALALSGLTFDHIAALTFNLQNTLTFQEALGSLNPVGIGGGALEITGNLSMYVDSTMFNVLTAFQDGVASGLTFEVGRTAGKKTRFELPNIIVENVKASAESATGDVMASMSYRALQATSLSGSVARVTRNI